MALVYVVTHVASGKRYVGMTTRDMAVRRREHIKDKRGHCRKFHAALRKHGAEAFTWDVRFDGLTVAEAVVLEERTIARLGAMYPGGYNLIISRVAGKMSEESRKRCSEASSRGWQSEATRRRRVAGLRKVFASPAVRRTLCAAQRLRRDSEGASARVSMALADMALGVPRKVACKRHKVASATVGVRLAAERRDTKTLAEARLQRAIAAVLAGAAPSAVALSHHVDYFRLTRGLRSAGFVSKRKSPQKRGQSSAKELCVSPIANMCKTCPT